MKKLFTMLMLLTFISSTLMAVPAKRTPRTFTQPDGTTVTVVLQGDEHFHYYTTTDGVMVTRGENGYFYYANITEDGLIKASNLLAHNKGNRKTNDLNFIQQINESKISSIIETSRVAKSKARKSPLKASDVGTKDTQKILVLLIQYSDVKFSEGNNTLTNFQNRVSKDGYTGERDHGSIYDYFVAQSKGLFTPQFDVVGPVTLDNPMKYYGENKSNGDDIRPGEMIKEACQKAKSQGLVNNFAIYDNNQDGYVDVVYTLYAGYGEASSDEANSIWPHQWYLSAATGSALTLDGVKIDKYACNNEMLPTFDEDKDGNLIQTGSEIDGIGTFCHEFSHCLGLPDFYDTRDTNSPNFGMDSWSLMDYGSYNDNGHTPCGYTAYEKEFMGWLNIETLNSPKNIELKALNTDEGKAYRIVNENNTNEYYLLENRQKTGWDSQMAGNGLLAIHVDYSASAWNQNTVNNTSSRQRMSILPADGTLSHKTLSGDTYPGANKVSSIASFPVFTGSALNKPVTNIKEENGIITFNFMEGLLPTPIAKEAAGITSTGFTANWEALPGAESYTLKVTKVEKSTSETLMEEDFSKITKLQESTNISAKLDSYTKEPGWQGENIYGGDNMCRVGTSNIGYLLTPYYDFSSGDITVALHAKKYATADAPTLWISLANDGEEDLTDGGGAEIGNNMELYYIVLSGGSDMSYIQLDTEGTKPRVFIDDVTIYSGDVSEQLESQNAKHIINKKTSRQTIAKNQAKIAKALYANDVPALTFTTTSTSYEVTGLEPNATYTYSVKAHQGSKESAYSEAITVDLSTATGIDCNPTELYNAISTTGNYLYVSTEEGKIINIYSIDGILKQSVTAQEGENQIRLTNGIYIVRVGNASAKVIISAQ